MTGDAVTGAAPANSRAELAAAQARLLRALLAGAAVPHGFDAAQVAVEVRALRNKRAMIAGQLRPDIRAALGKDRFAQLFTEYAIVFPRRTGLRAREDADYFASWLAARGELPRPSRWQRLALVFRAGLTELGDRIRKPRQP